MSVFTLSYTGKKQTVQEVVIEQEPWPDGTGTVTTLNILEHINSKLFGGAGASIFCGMLDDGFETALLVWPFDPAWNYNVGITWGWIGSKTISTQTETQTITFRNSDTASLKYPVDRIVSQNIFGDALNETGGIISKPILQFSGQKVTASKKTYSSFDIVYKTIRHRYQILIDARPIADGVDRHSVDNVFGSTAWANGSGLAKMQEIAAAAGALENWKNETDCKYTGGGAVTVDPSGESDVLIKHVDYC